jgi:hypothetical protein
LIDSGVLLTRCPSCLRTAILLISGHSFRLNEMLKITSTGLQQLQYGPRSWSWLCVLILTITSYSTEINLNLLIWK